MAADDILEAGSPAALVTAVEENLFAFARRFGRWERMETHQAEDVQWYFSDVPFPMFNSATALRLDAARADAVIAGLIERAQARGVPLMVWTGPSTTPPDLGRRLQAAGFLVETAMPGMALALAGLADAAAPAGDVRIERVTDAETLARWCRTVVRGFELPAFVEAPFLELSLAMGIGPDGPVRNYLGTLEGHAVAASTAFLASGVAGIYNVVTLPSARRRGIGRAVTQRALRDARDAGYKVAILHSSAQGEPLYRSMGFRRVCSVTTYVWPGAGPA